MSWWVSLEDENGEPVTVVAHQEGGTWALGGTTGARLDITHNYSPFYREHLNAEGLRWLDGKRAGDVAEALDAAIKKLGTEQADNYWDSTPGNAGHALFVLSCWAARYPDAIFRVR